MARFFLDHDGGGELISIGGDDARHIARVLRMQPGERVELVLNGQLHAGELISVHPDQVQVLRGPVLPEDSESPLEIHLYQALPKGDKLDLIVQKATELGVSSITPVLTERVVVKLKDLSSGHKLERWQRIAAEAAKQSRRIRIPTIQPPLTLANLPIVRDRLRLVAWEESERPLAGLLQSQPPTRAVDALIGPEGGLTAAEIRLLNEHGFHSISLGPRILRTETAPLALLAILQYQLGDLGGER